MTTLRGARVVVTGGSSGIGAACATAFRAAGARVTIVSGDPARLAAASRTLGVDGRVADLTDPTQTRALAAWLAGESRPDVLLHAAGVGLVAAGARLQEDASRRLVEVNLMAPLLLTSAALPAMLERGTGHLVFVGSIAGTLGVSGESVYAASKGALAAYAASIAAELGPAGVRVTTVLPGVVDTPFFARRRVPYTRRFPRPVPAARVADQVVRAVERDRAQVVVPGWLRLPMLVAVAAPRTYARMAGRWG